MTRHLFGSLIGGIVGGLALYLVGFLFWGTPLAGLAMTRADPQASAAIQTVLAQTLTTSGTGAYIVPDPSTAGGSTLFGRGPIAMVQFNTAGYPVVDSASLLAGLVLAIAVGIAIAVALRSIAAGVPRFADRARVVLLFAIALPAYIDLGQPLFNHFGWGYFIYGFLCDAIGFAAAGLVIARWFLPKAPLVP